MKDRKQIEYKTALLPFTNADLLFWKILIAGLRHPDHVIFRLEVGDAELAALSLLVEGRSVEKYFGLVLAGHNHERSNVLSRLNKGGQRRNWSRFDGQFVFFSVV